MSALAIAVARPPEADAAKAKLGIEVTFVSRFGGDLNGDGRLDPSVDPVDAPRDLGEVEVVAHPAPGACSAGAAATWLVDGQSAATGQDCSLDLRGPVGAKRELELRLGGAVARKTVQLNDKLVVALGDSVASGEGNPGPGGRWLDPRCHRGAAAGFEQAARLVAAANTSGSLTFVNLACSGATIAHGLLGPYAGIAHEHGPRPAGTQVERLARLDGERPVDAVLISIGANDVNFEPLIRHCALVPDCASAPLHAGQAEDADSAEAAALTQLASSYDGLARALAPIVPPPRTGPTAGTAPVILSEYFDPLTGPTGKLCSHLFGGAITHSELQWAEDSVLQPLNGEASAAAHRHHWQFAGGIAAAFRGHGYCAGSADRWVNRLSESLPSLRGTLHPNLAGHLAIADRTAPSLAVALGLAKPPAPAEPPSNSTGANHDVRVAIVIALLALVLIVVLIAMRRTRSAGRAWATRLAWLPRHTSLADRMRTQSDLNLPTLVPHRDVPPSPLVDALLKALGALLAGVVSLGFVAFVGGAIETVRFWAARYPVDQAVKAVSRQQLLVVGAQALSIFAILGVAAVIVLWLVDPSGRPVHATRRAVALLVFIELVIAVAVGDYGMRQARELVLGFAVATLLAAFVVDVAVSQGNVVARVRQAPHQFVRVPSQESLPRRVAHVAVQVAPFVLLAFAVGNALVRTHASDRLVYVLLPVFLAAILLMAPASAAEVAWSEPPAATPAAQRARALVPARTVLALVLLLSFAAFVIHDEKWLAGAALAAMVLSALVLTIGRVSGNRFLPFAIAIFFAAGAYGGILACLRTVDAPQGQPVAVLVENNRAVCGVWAGDGGGRLWIGQVQLAERGALRRPAPRRSQLISVPESKQIDSAIGPLQRIGLAVDQAVRLRDGLEAQHPGSHWHDSGPQCLPRPPVPPPKRSRERSIAERVQPELVVDRRDGFWPVPVRTLFSMEDRRARICRRVADGVCIRLLTQGDLPWAGGEGEWLDYPADGLHVDDERTVEEDALGSLDPDKTAREYFLVTRGAGPDSPWTVQFWFFYTFNYQPLNDTLGLVHAGYHEGDWESIGLLLSAHTHRPRYVWMARHENEGQVFVWNEPALHHVAGRLQVFAAKGSHADYESCLRQKRHEAPAGLIDDRPQCDPTEQLHLSPEATPLTDLSRVPWACWHGRFGHHPGDQIQERVPYESADGPLGPLWQQHFGGVTSEPCRGIPDPGHRDGPVEEVLPNRVAKQLQARAGRLDPLANSCSDWERPPATGVYLVACSPDQIGSYFASGLEDPGAVSLHIDTVTADKLAAGPPSVPAVRRDAQLRRLDDWRVAASGAITAEVYAACPSGDARLEVRFPIVRFRPQERLRLDDRERSIWRLRDEDGATVASATPHLLGTDKPPRLACN